MILSELPGSVSLRSRSVDIRAEVGRRFGVQRWIAVLVLMLDNKFDSPNSVHVLIVGVGRPEGLKPIPGMGATVKAAYNWWRSADPRCLDGHRVGSVDVLASDEHPILLDDGAGDHWEPQFPTLERLRECVTAWIGRVAQGGVGVIHWAGHGACSGHEGGSIWALYIQDLLDGVPRAIDAMVLVDAMRRMAKGAKILFFIDACRLQRAKSIGALPNVLESYASAGPPPFLLSGAYEHKVAKSHALPIPIIKFGGGPIFTNATLDAFDRYGSSDHGATVGYRVTAGSVPAAVRQRMRRIVGHTKSTWTPEAQTIIEPRWVDEPLLKMPRPESMIDITLRDGGCPRTCTVSNGTGTEASWQGPGRFEASIGYSPHHFEVQDDASTPSRTSGFTPSQCQHNVQV